jgi:flagellar hook-length control protein FliK
MIESVCTVPGPAISHALTAPDAGRDGPTANSDFARLLARSAAPAGERGADDGAAAAHAGPVKDAQKPNQDSSDAAVPASIDLATLIPFPPQVAPPASVETPPANAVDELTGAGFDRNRGDVASPGALQATLAAIPAPTDMSSPLDPLAPANAAAGSLQARFGAVNTPPAKHSAKTLPVTLAPAAVRFNAAVPPVAVAPATSDDPSRPTSEAGASPSTAESLAAAAGPMTAQLPGHVTGDPFAPESANDANHGVRGRDELRPAAASTTEAGNLAAFVPGALSGPVSSGPQPNHASTLLVATPVDSSAWSKDFGQHVIRLAVDGQPSAEIHLNPPEMGPIRISIEIRGQEATINFAAAHADTRGALENALPALRELFAANDLSLGGTHVSSQAFSQNPSPRDGNQSGATVRNFVLHEDGADASLAALPSPRSSPLRPGVDLFA